MTVDAPCPSCGRVLQLPDDAAGKRVRCRQCSTLLGIQAVPGGGLTLRAVEAPPRACATCGADIAATDAFCAHCGAPADAGAPAQPAHVPRIDREARRGRRVAAARGRRVGQAATWIVVMGCLMVLGGLVTGCQARKQVEQLRLDDYPNDKTWDIEGETYSTSELKKVVDDEVKTIYIASFVIAGVMFLLAWWARIQPLPAILVALCVFVLLMLVNAALEPETLFKGLLVKILFIVALVKGLTAALEQRAAATAVYADRAATGTARAARPRRRYRR